MDLSDWLDEEITVLEFTFIDNPENFQKPEELFLLTSDCLVVLEKVKAAFLKSGWEGDGEIGVVWLPPFLYIPTPDKITSDVLEGTFVWHVKQRNNGISFLGFYPEGLKYIANNSLLANQNDHFFDEE